MGFHAKRLMCIGFLAAARWHRTCSPCSTVMSASPPDLITTFVRRDKTAESANTSPDERRGRVRSSVHWPVSLFHSHQGAEAVESTTQDLSSAGFYCFSKTPFALGEFLRCALRVPANDSAGKEAQCRLECRVLVVRVEPNAAEGHYGIACRIEDYRIAQCRPVR